MALSVGDRLGHYDVTALIGEGGMGQVYQATDTKLNCQVALKILSEAFATGADGAHEAFRELEDVRRRNLAVLGGRRCIKKRIWAAKIETPTCDFPALSASELDVRSPSQPFRLWAGAVRT